MRDEHAALDMVGGHTVKDSSLDQANLLQVLQTQQENLAEEFQRNLFTALEAYTQLHGENSAISYWKYMPTNE